jgi:hypothetical protein
METEKKKLLAPRLGTIPFLLIWIAGHILVWILLYGVSEMGIQNEDTIYIALISFGLIMGVGLSFMQKYLIEFTYYAPLKWWLRITIFGWIVAWIVFYASYEFVEEFIGNNLSLMLIPLFVIPATMQWFVLHKSARNAWLWIVAGAVSALTFGVLYGDLNDNELRQFVLGAAAQGAVTGLSLLWLYGQSRAEKAKVAAS